MEELARIGRDPMAFRSLPLSFKQPIAVTFDKAGNAFVADRDNHFVRMIDPSGKVTVFAGTGATGFADGSAPSAQFNQPYGLALSPDEKSLYVADYLNHAIRAIDLASKRVTTLAGSGKAGFADGIGDKAQFNQPYNVKADARGRLYVPDQNNHAIRRVDPDGTVTTLAGNGQALRSAGPRKLDSTIRPAWRCPAMEPSMSPTATITAFA